MRIQSDAIANSLKYWNKSGTFWCGTDDLEQVLRGGSEENYSLRKLEPPAGVEPATC
jgi:hypothetical protein